MVQQVAHPGHILEQRHCNHQEYQHYERHQQYVANQAVARTLRLFRSFFFLRLLVYVEVDGTAACVPGLWLFFRQGILLPGIFPGPLFVGEFYRLALLIGKILRQHRPHRLLPGHVGVDKQVVVAGEIVYLMARGAQGSEPFQLHAARLVHLAAQILNELPEFSLSITPCRQELGQPAEEKPVVFFLCGAVCYLAVWRYRGAVLFYRIGYRLRRKAPQSGHVYLIVFQQEVL